MVEKQSNSDYKHYQSILQQQGLLKRQRDGIYNEHQSMIKERLQQENINDHQSMAAHEKMDSETSTQKLDSQASASLKSSDKYLLPQQSEEIYGNLYHGDTVQAVHPSTKSTESSRGLMLVFDGKRWKFDKPALRTQIYIQMGLNDRRTIGNEPARSHPSAGRYEAQGLYHGDTKTELHPSGGRYEAPGLYHGDAKTRVHSSKKSAGRLPTHQDQPSKKFKKSIGTRRLLDTIRFVAGRVKLNSRPKAGSRGGSQSVKAGSNGGSKSVKEANKKGASSSKSNPIRDIQQMRNDWYIIKPPRAGKDSPTAMKRSAVERYRKEKRLIIGNEFVALGNRNDAVKDEVRRNDSPGLSSSYNQVVKNEERRNDMPGLSSADKTEHTDNLYWLWR